MGCRRHKGSHFWRCRKCGCEKNVQGKCRRCGCPYQESQKIKVRNNNYGQPKVKERQAERNSASEVQRPKGSGKKINVRKMVKLHRRMVIAACLSASKNYAVAANI
ncbi:hypothetical protein KJ866_03010 [Patescibacteria group bacterium]|nr:hypothetical protein [Patescibacteria group bacterium]